MQDLSGLDNDQIVCLVTRMLAENAVAAVWALREIVTRNRIRFWRNRTDSTGNPAY